VLGLDTFACVTCPVSSELNTWVDTSVDLRLLLRDPEAPRSSALRSATLGLPGHDSLLRAFSAFTGVCLASADFSGASDLDLAVLVFLTTGVDFLEVGVFCWTLGDFDLGVFLTLLLRDFFSVCDNSSGPWLALRLLLLDGVEVLVSSFELLILLIINRQKESITMITMSQIFYKSDTELMWITCKIKILKSLVSQKIKVLRAN
jgi:hypothetical protein